LSSGSEFFAPVFGAVAFLLPAGGLFSRVVAFLPPAVAEGAVAFAWGGAAGLFRLVASDHQLVLGCRSSAPSEADLLQLNSNIRHIRN